MPMPTLFKFIPAACAALLCLTAATELNAEWGVEGALGANPTAYAARICAKITIRTNQRYRGGATHSFAGKLHYEWVGFRFLSDYYFAGSGKQKTQSSVQTAPNQGYSQQSSEQQGVPYSAAQSYRAELQLRKFYYGHREIFAFNTGLAYRRVVIDGPEHRLRAAEHTLSLLHSWLHL